MIYGSLEGYLKAIDIKTGEELYSFKTASSIISNISTWQYQGKQYVGVLYGLGGWPAIATGMKNYMSREYNNMDHGYFYKGLGSTIRKEIRKYNSLSDGALVIFELGI